jgi:hypothetical protein
MKKILHTLLFLLVATGITFGQDIIYTISGEINNQKVPLDSIMVENLSNNTWMTFNNLPSEQYYQINLTKKAFWGTVGINEVNNGTGFIEVQNLPGSIILSYRKNTPERINLSIYNIAGQKIYSESNKLINPGNSIKVQPGATGVYLIKIETPKETHSFKVIGQTAKTLNKIEVLDGSSTITPIKSAEYSVNENFAFKIGDSIRVSVYKSNKYAAPLKNRITGPGKLNFNFEGMTDSASVMTSGVIAFPEAPNFNISGLSALSINNKSDVKVNGSFQLPNLTDGGDELPILFTKGEDVLFGAIPIESNGTTITLDEILLFYFKLFPDITFLELSDANLLELIQSDPNYSELIRINAEALNANASPTANSSFNELLQESAYNITQNKKLKSAKELLPPNEFNFNFGRSGKLTWPSTAPIHATMGFEIKAKKDNKIVYGPCLLNPFQWVFAPTSVVAWGIDAIFKIFQTSTTPSFNFTDEGEYIVSFTNGNEQGTASPELFKMVSETNRNAFVSDLIFLIVPEAFKSLFNSDCQKRFTEIFFTQGEFIKGLILNGATKQEVVKAIYGIGGKFPGLIIDCNPANLDNTKKSEFVKKYLGFMKSVDVLEKSESATNLLFLAKDYYGSKISGEETRFFYDNISFGELESKSTWATKFKGPTDGKQYYEDEVKEKIIKYKFDRSVTETNLTKEETWTEANELPFKATLLSGDAIIDNLAPKAEKGIYWDIFTMGKDSSTVQIEPAFKNSGIEPVTITLIPTFSLEKFLIENGPWGNYDYNDEYNSIMTFTFKEGGLIELLAQFDDNFDNDYSDWKEFAVTTWGLTNDKVVWLGEFDGIKPVYLFFQSINENEITITFCEDIQGLDCDDQTWKFVSTKNK